MQHEPETPLNFHVVDPEEVEAIASMTAYFEELGRRFVDGFDPGDTLSADADQFRPPRGRFLIGRSGGAVVSCGGVYLIEPTRAEIKRMWVAPDARGKGIGAQTLHVLEQTARELCAVDICLDTNSVLAEAISLYRSRGYKDINVYNDNPYAHCWFAKKLGPRGPELRS